MQKDFYRILGLSPGSTKKQIKSAYRKLALKYHPDRNPSPAARQKFQEITEAYDKLLDYPGAGIEDATSYDEQVAAEILRRERELMKQRARAQREKKKQQDEYFNRPEWHDPILFLKYAGNYILFLFALSSVVLPILLAILEDPASLAGTSIFIVLGVILLVFLPVESVLWRFMAGLLGGGIVSTVVLKLFRVRSKTSYLLTPGLIVKMAIWIFSLDMLFDLVIGIFPFYRKMFRPVIKQGITLDSLYKEGYQNYQELPVYSVMYPLIRWLF